jgi:hypothetical protein
MKTKDLSGRVRKVSVHFSLPNALIPDQVVGSGRIKRNQGGSLLRLRRFGSTGRRLLDGMRLLASPRSSPAPASIEATIPRPTRQGEATGSCSPPVPLASQAHEARKQRSPAPPGQANPRRREGQVGRRDRGTTVNDRRKALGIVSDGGAKSVKK